MAGEHLQSAADLVGTAYGRALLAKLAALGVAVLVAGVAARVGRPYARRLRAAEGAVLAVVVGLAGLLVSLPPPA